MININVIFQQVLRDAFRVTLWVVALKHILTVVVVKMFLGVFTPAKQSRTPLNRARDGWMAMIEGDMSCETPWEWGLWSFQETLEWHIRCERGKPMSD